MPRPGVDATATHWCRAIKAYGAPPACVSVAVWWPHGVPLATWGWTWGGGR